MQSFVKYLLILFFLALAANSYCASAELKTNNEIKKAVDNFCLMEFQGKLMDEERGTLVKYTPDSEDYKKFEMLTKNSEDDEHLYPYEWDLSKDPFYIVDAYNVVSVKQIDEMHADAVISYHQLARVAKSGNELENYLKNFVKDEKNVTTHLEVILITKKFMRNNVHEHKWLIVNPSYPNVSLDAVLKYYDDRVLYAHKRILGNTYPRDVNKYTENYNNYKSIVEFLSELRK